MKACFSKTSFILFGCLFFVVSFAGNIVKVEQDLSCKENCNDNSFVIKKDTKKSGVKASKSKLQEQACTVFGDQIACVPDINQKVSQVQKILLEHTCKYLESSSDCILLKSDKQKMDEILKVAKIFEEKMEDFVQDCDKYLEYLKGLK